MSGSIVTRACIAVLGSVVLSGCSRPDLSDRLEPELQKQISTHIAERRAEFEKRIKNNPLLALGAVMSELSGDSIEDSFPSVVSVDLMKVSDRQYSGIVQFSNSSTRSVRLQFDESMEKYQWEMQ